MFSLSARDRCKKCSTERALRLCPRTKKGICWKCCNQLRIDLKCPSSCPYAPRIEHDSPFPAFKADNNHEALDATKKYLDLWIRKQNEAFDNASPLDMATNHKKKTLEILGGYQYPGNFPVDYLMDKLGLPHESEEIIEHAEDVVSRFLDQVIALNFMNMRSFTQNDSELADLKERYENILSQISYFKKLKKYSFIHTGMSEDGSSCIVFVELNLKHEFCFVLREAQSIWYIRQVIVGNPSMYFKQNAMFSKIAQLLGQADASTAFAEVSEALRSFPDNSDLYYYRGLCRLVNKENDKAKVDLLNSIALDNFFSPPYMHLGILYLNDKNYAEAELWFAALCRIEPENMDAANNLGITLIAQGKKDEALRVWQEILDRDPGHELARKNLELYG